jgi:O-antigen ligase
LIKEQTNIIFDRIILIFLTVQVFSVYFSVAVSSFAFVIWTVTWIIQIILNKSFNTNKQLFSEIKYINIFLALFFVIEILSRVFAVIPEGAFLTLKSYLLFIIFYVSIIKINKKEILYKIVISILIIVSLLSVYELIRYFVSLKDMPTEVEINSDRIGFFGYPISMGELKMLLLLMVFPLLFSKEKFFMSKIFLLLLLIPIFISMYLTQSRNVFVAIFISLIIYGIIINKKFLIYFATILIIFWFIIPARFQNRIESIANPNFLSNESRLVMWNVGMQMFKDHPLLGIGDNEFTKVYKLYKEPQIEGEGSHLHSNYLMILATTGIFGFIFYISFFIAIFLKQIKFYRNVLNETDKLLIFGSILMMISFHISGIFEWNFGDWKVLSVLLFLTSISFILYNINFNKNLKQE